MAEPIRRPDSTGQSALASAIGPQWLIRLAAMLRTAKTHDVANQAFQRQLQESLGVVQKLIEVEQ